MTVKYETIYFAKQQGTQSAEFTDIQLALDSAAAWVESDPVSHTPVTITTYIKVSEV